MPFTIFSVLKDLLFLKHIKIVVLHFIFFFFVQILFTQDGNCQSLTGLLLKEAHKLRLRVPLLYVLLIGELNYLVEALTVHTATQFCILSIVCLS